MTMPELALRWILAEPTVSTIIPGMRKIPHVESNIAASDSQALDARPAGAAQSPSMGSDSDGMVAVRKRNHLSPPVGQGQGIAKLLDTLKMRRISGDQFQAVHQGGGGDHGIGQPNGLPDATPVRRRCGRQAPQRPSRRKPLPPRPWPPGSFAVAWSLVSFDNPGSPP